MTADRAPVAPDLKCGNLLSGLPGWDGMRSLSRTEPPDLCIWYVEATLQITGM